MSIVHIDFIIRLIWKLVSAVELGTKKTAGASFRSSFEAIERALKLKLKKMLLSRFYSFWDNCSVVTLFPATENSRGSTNESACALSETERSRTIDG